ncbi:hypothetical protein D3C81_454140 [compost metagenome]
MPLAHLPTRLVQQPMAKGDADTGFFRRRHEHLGCQPAALGVQPAHPGRHAEHLATPQVDLRQELQLQLVVLQRVLEVVGQGYPLADFAGDLLAMELELVAAFFLGPVQGHVRLCQQAIGAQALGGVQADADARRQAHGIVVQVVGLGQGIADLAGQGGTAGRLVDVQLQNGKLVATQAGNHVVLAGAGAEPSCHLLQQQVTDRMAEGVIDPFEMIQVQVEHRKWRCTAPGGGKRLVQALDQHGPVGKAGEAIGTCHQGEFLFGQAALGNVEDDAFDFHQLALGVAYRDIAVLDPAQGVIGGAQAELDGGCGGITVQYPRHGLVEFAQVIGMHQGAGPIRSTDQPGCRVTELGDVVRDVHQGKGRLAP